MAVEAVDYSRYSKYSLRSMEYVTCCRLGENIRAENDTLYPCKKVSWDAMGQRGGRKYSTPWYRSKINEGGQRRNRVGDLTDRSTGNP